MYLLELLDWRRVIGVPAFAAVPIAQGKKPWIAILRICAALLVGVCMASPALADCTFVSGSMGTATISPPSTISVQKSVVVGTILYDSGWVATSGTPKVTCSTASIITAGYTVAMNPVSNDYDVFPTGIPGIGIKVGWLNSLSSGGISVEIAAIVGTSQNRGTAIASTTYGPIGIFDVQYIVTGPVSAGVSTLPLTLAQASYGTTVVNRLVLAAPTTFVFVACTTPNVTVPMGTHKASELSGVGTTTTAVAFNISLNSCPAGMGTSGPAIQYEIDPSTTVVSSANAVVSLDSGSTASGIGVQLLNGSGVPVPLGTRQTFSGYNPSTGGSYTIPLQARYYRTATVTPGTADTEMTFTMTYQ